MDRLAESTDPRDHLGAALLSLFQNTRRLTLGDVIRTAGDLGYNDDDAVAAVERLARPNSANLRRFYVDCWCDENRTVSYAEFQERASGGNEAFMKWASQVEVVWALDQADAIGDHHSGHESQHA